MTYFSLGLLAFAITSIYAWGISHIPVLAFGDPIGPRALPQLLALALVLTGMCLMIQALRQRQFFVRQLRELRQYFTSVEWRTVYATSTGLGLYLLCFDHAGYLISTSLFLSILMLAAHNGRKSVAVLSALGFTLGSYLLFTRVFGLPLPHGLLPF